MHAGAAYRGWHICGRKRYFAGSSAENRPPVWAIRYANRSRIGWIEGRRTRWIAEGKSLRGENEMEWDSEGEERSEESLIGKSGCERRGMAGVEMSERRWQRWWWHGDMLRGITYREIDFYLSLWEPIPLTPYLLKVSECNLKMMMAKISPRRRPVGKRYGSLFKCNKSLCVCWWLLLSVLLLILLFYAPTIWRYYKGLRSKGRFCVVAVCTHFLGVIFVFEYSAA